MPDIKKLRKRFCWSVADAERVIIKGGVGDANSRDVAVWRNRSGRLQ